MLSSSTTSFCLSRKLSNKCAKQHSLCSSSYHTPRLGCCWPKLIINCCLGSTIQLSIHTQPGIFAEHVCCSLRCGQEEFSVCEGSSELWWDTQHHPCTADTTPEPHWNKLYYFHSLLHKELLYYCFSLLVSQLNKYQKGTIQWISNAYRLHNPTIPNEMVQVFNVRANKCYL